MSGENNEGKWVNANDAVKSQLSPELLSGCRNCTRQGSACGREDCAIKDLIEESNKRNNQGGGRRVRPAGQVE